MFELLTAADIARVENCRLARLREVIPAVADLILFLDLEYVLHVHSAEIEPINALLGTLAAVSEAVYIVSGCCEICFWAGEEVIAYESIGLQSAVDIRNDESSTMSTAIAENTATASIQKTSTKVDKLPGQTLAAIAEDTEQPIDSIRAWIEERNGQIIPFNGEEIVAGEVASEAIDHFTMLLIQQRKARRGLQAAAPAPTFDGNGAMDAPAPERKTRAKAAPTERKPRAAKAERGGLSLAAGYKTKTVKGQTRANLLRALPQKPAQKEAYLAEIVNGSEKGQEFLDKVASVIVKNYGGDKEKQIASLLEMARKLQKAPATPEPEKAAESEVAAS